MTTWSTREHYFCVACGWTAPQADFLTEPVRCPRCGALPDGSDPWPAGTYVSPKDGRTCYHCGETLHSNILASQHFGAPPDGVPGCLLKVERGERGLLVSLREAEEELARYRIEDSDKDRQLHAMVGEHAAALQREEEAGYAKGLRDARAEHGSKDEIVAALHLLTEEQRLDVFHEFCIHCGSTDDNCQCWNDE